MEIKYERSEGDVAYVGFKFIKGAAQRRPENFQGPKNDNPDNGKRPNILEKSLWMYLMMKQLLLKLKELKRKEDMMSLATLSKTHMN